MPLAALALLVTVQATAPDAWKGVWKPTDPASFARLRILTADTSGLTIDVDEGLGKRGQRQQGAAAWAGTDRVRLGLSDCTGTLTLVPGGRWGVEIHAAFEQCFMGFEQVVFIREEVRRDHPTSFDCAAAEAPLERAICGDATLAAADRRLARVYQATLGRAGDRKHAVRRDERAWLARRARTCRAVAEPAGCILESIGRRLLELRAWPDTAFGASGQPAVAVITRVLTTAPDAVADSGVREMLCGRAVYSRVECDPEGLTLAVYPEPGGIAVMGWTLGTSYETAGLYLGFRSDGPIWSSVWGPGGRGEGGPADVAPRPRRGQRLPESLRSFRVEGPADNAVVIEEQETARRAPDWVGHWTSIDPASAASIDIFEPFQGGFRIEWHEGDALRSGGGRDLAHWIGDREAALDGPAPDAQCRIVLTEGGRLQAVLPVDACFGPGEHWRRPFVRKETKRK